MPIAFTIDFERLSHARAFRNLDANSEARIELDKITQRILDLLDRTDNLATFYVVANIAEASPDLVRSLSECGHEIGSHTYSHRRLPELHEEELEREVTESKHILEEIIESPVLGFRAPELNHTKASLSAVARASYVYDSSGITSVPIPRFYASWERLDSQEPQPITVASTTLVEVPVSVNPQLRIPISGAWMRLLGRRYTLWSLDTLQQRGHTPVIYLHPRAFQQIPHSSGLPRRITYHSGAWTFDLVEKLLTRYDSVPMSTLAEKVES